MCTVVVTASDGTKRYTGTQAGNVSCAICEQASWDDGYDSDDAVELVEWQKESDAEYGDVAWTGDVDEPMTVQLSVS